MEVVLLENIKNLGQIGDIVKVKRGHGRNFLIKYGKMYLEDYLQAEYKVLQLKLL